MQQYGDPDPLGDLAKRAAPLTNVKQRIVKDATRAQVMLRGIPGYRLRSKVNDIVDTYSDTTTRANPHRTPCAYLATDEHTLDAGMLDTPRVLKRAEELSELPLAELQSLILERVKAQAQKLGEIQAQAVAKYAEERPEQLRAYFHHVREEKVAQFREALAAARGGRHEHVYARTKPGDLTKARPGLRFPIAQLKQSHRRVVLCASGGSAFDRPQARPRTLPPVARPGRSPSDMDASRRSAAPEGNEVLPPVPAHPVALRAVDPRPTVHPELPKIARARGLPPPRPSAATAGLTLARFLRRDSDAPSDDSRPLTPAEADPYFELDEGVVVDLPSNGGALLQEMRAVLDDEVGPVAVHPADGLEQRYRRALHPPSATAPRVAIGSTGRRSPDREHNAAEALRAVDPPVPLLSSVELALVDGVAVPGVLSDGDDDEAQPEPDYSHIAGAGPTGFLGAALRDIDTAFYLHVSGQLGEPSPEEEPADFDPECLVCTSRADLGGGKTLAGRPHRSLAVARRALDTWRSRQRATQDLLGARLQDELTQRSSAKAHVTGSQQYTADVLRTAHAHASAWGSARCLAGRRSPTPDSMPSPKAKDGAPRPTALWDATHSTLEAERHNVAQCELLWRRLVVFCRSTGAPTSADAVAAVECLRVLLQRTRLVSRQVFFRWLRWVGPKILEARDLVRLCLWLRLELHITAVTFQRWTRLPDNKAAGWKLLAETFD